MILYSYILYYEEPNYIQILPVYQRMALMATTGSGFQPCALVDIIKYRGHP